MTPADLAAFIEKEGIRGEMVHLEAPTPTVETAAEAVGSSTDQIIKSVLFLIHGSPVLAILCGLSPIDRRTIAAHLGVGRKQVKLADAAAVEEITGYPVGGVPPFGHPMPVETLIDPIVLEQAFVFGGGGDHHTLVRLAPEEILRTTAGTVLKLTGV